MTANKLTAVKIISAALDELPDKTIVLRGVVAPESLIHLQKDDYQREVMPLTSQSSILAALRKQKPLPDIELGMRGQRFKEHGEGSFLLLDPVFIVDGLQRVSGGIHHLQMEPGAPVRLGATVYFDTTKEWERERFRILNTLRTKVSPNILLRNMREESRAVLMLFGLSTNDRMFVLHDRVSWGQRMVRGELITALTFAKAAQNLHSHKGPTGSNSVAEIVPALDKTVDAVGLQNVRENIKAFYTLIDECWGIKRVQYRQGAVHMRGQFLFVLAKLLSDHNDFWQQPDEKKLFVPATLKRKLAQFPINDQHISNLAGSGGKARELLYMLLRDHINKGKTTKRLSSRVGDMVLLDEDDDVSEEVA